MAAGHTDQELFEWLSNGVAGTAMSPFNRTIPSKIMAGTPDGPWREVARWRNLGLTTSEERTVSGPWRIRWRLQTDDEPFVVMVEEGQ